MMSVSPLLEKKKNRRGKQGNEKEKQSVASQHQDNTTQRFRNSSQRKHLLETTEEHNILALC